MKKTVCMVLCCMTMLLLISCAKTVEMQMKEPEKISAKQAKDLMDDGAIVVDVRTQEEYDQSHIDGAILIPNETISDTPPELLPDKNAQILVYCKTGRRSAQAAKKLYDLDYKNVFDFGGIVEWPYGTVKTENTQA
ncbi:MAG: rhodanese-like domain-containing protein [Christensenellaceae bacterium]